MTYNLFWWNLFGQRGGGNAGNLIRAASVNQLVDLIGFQECDNVHQVLSDANLTDTFATVSPGHAVVIAYRSNTWELITSGMDDVAEDLPVLYGRRVAVWARFLHKTTGITL